MFPADSYHLVFTNRSSLLYGDYLIDLDEDSDFMSTHLQFGSDTFKTWEDIMEGMFSSDSSKQIDHRVVFSDYYNIENTDETIDPSEETEEPSESEEI